MKNSNTMLEVCIGNYGYYAEGELRDQWLSLPMNPDELKTWPERHGLRDASHEEIYVSDYDCEKFDLYKMFGEFAQLDDLNRVAYAMSICEDLDKVARYMELADDQPTMNQFIELLLSADEISYSDFPCDSLGNPSLYCFGIELAEETGLEKALVDNGADCYFDYYRYAESMLFDYLYDDSGWIIETFDYHDYTTAEIDEMLIYSLSNQIARAA